MQEFNNINHFRDVVKDYGVGKRSLDDPFLDLSHNFCKIFVCKGVTVEDDEELCHEMNKFPCSACSVVFQNLLDYELHYHNVHRYVCAECKKQRPTARLLEIHVQETHDNFFKVLAERQSMYQCFVSECDVKFKDPEERKLHCTLAHEFPKNYKYYDTFKSSKTYEKDDNLMDFEESGATSKSNVRSWLHFGNSQRKKTFQASKKSCNESSVSRSSVAANTKTNVSAATMFIPRQVLRKNPEILKQKSIDMMELEESLPKI